MSKLILKIPVEPVLPVPLHMQVDMAVAAAADIDCIAVGVVSVLVVEASPLAPEVVVALPKLVAPPEQAVLPAVQVEFVVLDLPEQPVLQQVFRIAYRNSHFLRYCHILSNSYCNSFQNCIFKCIIILPLHIVHVMTIILKQIFHIFLHNFRLHQAVCPDLLISHFWLSLIAKNGIIKRCVRILT